MMEYWTSFAAGQPPVAAGQAAWPAFNLTTRNLLRINDTIVADTDYKSSVCALWDKVYEAGCQVLVCPCFCNVSFPVAR